MEEVYPGIYLIKEKGSYGAFKPPQNVYIIAGNDGLMVDAGYGDKKTVKYVVRQVESLKRIFHEEGREFNLKRVLVTHAHPDHFSGAVKLRKYLDLDIILTEKTAARLVNRKIFYEEFDASREQLLRKKKSLIGKIKDFFRRTIGHFMFDKAFGLTIISDPDTVIPENSEISVNGEKWKVFPSPGHSTDHLSLYNEEKGVIFTGDNILRSITSWLGPPDSNLEDYIQSITEISKLKSLKIALGAHGSPIEKPRERVLDLIKHREERLIQLENLVKENNRNGLTPTEVLKKIYPGEGIWKYSVARGYVVLTLEHLEKLKKIRREIGKKGVIRFFPVNSDK